jgi:hypothetical protein
MTPMEFRLSERQLEDSIASWREKRAQTTSEAQARGAFRARENSEAGIVVGFAVVALVSFVVGCGFWAFVAPALSRFVN